MPLFVWPVGLVVYGILLVNGWVPPPSRTGDGQALALTIIIAAFVYLVAFMYVWTSRDCGLPGHPACP